MRYRGKINHCSFFFFFFFFFQSSHGDLGMSRSSAISLCLNKSRMAVHSSREHTLARTVTPPHARPHTRTLMHTGERTSIHTPNGHTYRKHGSRVQFLCGFSLKDVALLASMCQDTSGESAWSSLLLLLACQKRIMTSLFI